MVAEDGLKLEHALAQAVESLAERCCHVVGETFLNVQQLVSHEVVGVVEIDALSVVLPLLDTVCGQQL